MKIHLLSNSNFSRFCFDETAKLCKVSDANFVRLLNKRVAEGNAPNPHDFIPQPSAGKRTNEGTMSEHLCNSQWPKPHFWFRSETWVSYLKKRGRTFWPRLKLFKISKFKLWSNYFIKIQYLKLRFDGLHMCRMWS